MRILVVLTKGEYGQRHLANIQQHKPESWQIETWQAAERTPKHARPQPPQCSWSIVMFDFACPRLSENGQL
jgi:hypothetical protein